jgi:hypothetical protein
MLSGIVYIDVGWHRGIHEKDGLPPTDEAEVQACWNIRDEADVDETLGEADFENAEFENVDDAIAWARERAPMVLVRLGPTEDKVYSAGERRATRDLPEHGGADLRPYPEWPPPDLRHTPNEARRPAG